MCLIICEFTVETLKAIREDSNMDILAKVSDYLRVGKLGAIISNIEAFNELFEKRHLLLDDACLYLFRDDGWKVALCLQIYCLLFPSQTVWIACDPYQVRIRQNSFDRYGWMKTLLMDSDNYERKFLNRVMRCSEQILYFLQLIHPINSFLSIIRGSKAVCRLTPVRVSRKQN